MAGTPFSVTIRAADSDGSTITSYTGLNALTDSTGTISPTTIGPFSNGVITLPVTITTTGSGITISTSGAGEAGTSNLFNVAPSNFDHFTITGNPLSVTAGNMINGIIVTARDVYNNIRTDYLGQVYFTSNDAQATLPYTSANRYTFTSGDQGTYIFDGFSLSTAGTRTITVTDSIRSASTGSITVNPASINQFTFSNIATPKTINTGFSVTITAKDQYGNTATGYSGSTSIAATTGPGTISPTPITFTSGQWTGTVTINQAGLGVTLSAIGGGATGTSNTFNIYGSLAFRSTINPTTFRSGTNQQYSITITNLDSGNTRLSSATVMIPAGYTVNSITTISVPPGKTWSSNIAGGSITISATGSNRLDPGQSVILTFTPTTSPTTGSIYTWTTTATGFNTPTLQPQTTIQYEFTVTSLYGTPTGAGWYNAGNTAYAGLSSGTINGPTDTRYVFTSWSGDAVGNNYAQSNGIIINGAKTASANWRTEYMISFVQSGVDVDFPGTVVIVNSVAYDRSGYSAWFESGSTVSYSYQTPLPVNSGKQYSKTSIDASPLMVTNPATFIGSYEPQYYLTVEANPSGVGSPTGSGWYRQGQNPPISTTPIVDVIAGQSRYYFTGWVGTGISDPSAATTTVTTGSTAQTITANYIEQFQIQVFSTQDTPTSSQWVNQANGLTTSVTSPAGIVLDDHQYVCTGYTIDTNAPVTDGSTSFSFSNVQAPHNITFNWAEQFWVTFAQAGLDNSVNGTIVTINSVPKSYDELPFSIWVDDSRSVQISASVISGHAFSSWNASGMITIADPLLNSTTITINGPGTVTANFL